MSSGELPAVIPLFPLPNVVLFPHVPLPLLIFEPRYRQMVADALEGDRLIGMALLRGDWQRDYHGNPDVYPVGCVGRMENVEALSDGRYNLVLRGIRAFRIAQELPVHAYRRARVTWQAEREASLARSALERVQRAVDGWLEGQGATRSAELRSAFESCDGADHARLINALAGGLDISPIEKLALLECDTVALRAERLAEVLEFQLAELRLGMRDDETPARRH